MASITLLYKETKTRLGSVTLDASVSETHQADVDVTEHPVEIGSAIADHIRPKPETVVIEGLISNTPMPDANAATSVLESNGFRYASRSTQEGSRAGQGYADLVALKDAGSLISVVTGLRTYDNMAITSLSVPRTPQTGQALRFTCALKQVRFATAKQTRIELHTQKKVLSGHQTPTPADEQTVKRSALKSVVNFFSQ